MFPSSSSTEKKVFENVGMAQCPILIGVMTRNMILENSSFKQTHTPLILLQNSDYSDTSKKNNGENEGKIDYI